MGQFSQSFFLSGNGAPINSLLFITAETLILRRSGKSVINTIKKLPYTRNLANWFSGKLLKLVATRCHILRLKCTKLDFRWVFAQTPLGELTALPRPPSWI